MYESKMALAVKANKRVLREVGDAVYLPFGCEYSLIIKNLNTVKALVRVWIDGTDVTDGTSLVIQPNSSMDLERFIKNGNFNEGNKFKFIERTAAISNHRGNKIDDGLIRIEFEFATAPLAWPLTLTNQKSWPQRHPDYEMYNSLINQRGFGDTTTFSTSSNIAHGEVSGQMGDFYDANSVAYASASATANAEDSFTPPPTPNTGVLRSARAKSASPATEVGITVPGSVSDQKFTEAAWFATDGIKHSMVLRVLGEAEGQPVVAPITVKHKVTCASCGRVNKVGAKFCSDCGTALQII